MQLFGTDLLKTYWAHDVEMTSMRRRYVASTSLRRHVPAGNLAPLAPPPPPQCSKPCSPPYFKLWPPNILNLPTPMLSYTATSLWILNQFKGNKSSTVDTSMTQFNEHCHIIPIQTYCNKFREIPFVEY